MGILLPRPSVCSGLRRFPGSRTFHTPKRTLWAKQDESVIVKYGLYSTTVQESHLAIGIKNLFYKYILVDMEILLPRIDSNQMFIHPTNICGGSIVFTGRWRYQDTLSRIFFFLISGFCNKEK